MKTLLSLAIMMGLTMAMLPVVEGKQQVTPQSDPAYQQPGKPARQRGSGQTPPLTYTYSHTENAHGDRPPDGTYFHTSERCVACHNGLKTDDGEDVSIGLQWQTSVMANSSRDPYWQGSLRRETLDHPESSQAIQDECSTCHIPAKRMPDRDRGLHTDVFATLPVDHFPEGDKAAADGVTCSVCHQIDSKGLGTESSFSGQVKFSDPVTKYLRAEYGPYEVTQGHKTAMHSSTATYVPMQAAHMRDAALCGSCHTLYTNALGPNGEKIARLPEQMPYQEWQHSSYNVTAQSGNERTCQSCHMPEVKDPVEITAIYGEKRQGMHRHVFVGGNFVMQGMLRDHRGELATVAQPAEMDAAIKRTREFLHTQTAKVTISDISREADKLAVVVHVENLGGHKLPTAYPARRVWLHVTVKDDDGRVVFESGHLNPDGSIAGNDNDQDKSKYEPHYREITSTDQVEIYEDILKDSQGRVTTGLLNAVGFLKDNRLLPHGFDKATAVQDVAVIGDAAGDPGFTDQGSTVRYIVGTGGARGPLHVTAEVWFEPVGYRWAHNLGNYSASEPQRFVRYFEDAAKNPAQLLSSAKARR